MVAHAMVCNCSPQLHRASQDARPAPARTSLRSCFARRMGSLRAANVNPRALETRRRVSRSRVAVLTLTACVAIFTLPFSYHSLFRTSALDMCRTDGCRSTSVTGRRLAPVDVPRKYSLSAMLGSAAIFFCILRDNPPRESFCRLYFRDDGLG